MTEREQLEKMDKIATKTLSRLEAEEKERAMEDYLSKFHPQSTLNPYLLNSGARFGTLHTNKGQE